MIEFFTIVSGIAAFFSIFKKVPYPRLVCLSILVSLSLLWGLRWEMASDWTGYYNYWIGKETSIGQLTFDPGFVFFTKIIYSLSDNYSIYLLIISFITYIGIIYSAFILTDKSFLSVFYLVGTIPWYAGSLRQMIACAFFSWAIKAVVDRRGLRYLALMILAISFHVTAIAFLPIYLLYGLSTGFYLVLFLLLVAFSPFADNLLYLLQYIVNLYGFDKNVIAYIGGSLNLSNPMLGALRKLITIGGLILFTVVTKSSRKLGPIKWNRNRFYLFLSSISIIFYYIGTYKITHVSSRLDIYTGLIVTGILIGSLDRTLTKTKNRILLYFFVTALVSVFYYRLVWMDLFHPYSSIFYNYDLHRELH